VPQYLNNLSNYFTLIYKTSTLLFVYRATFKMFPSLANQVKLEVLLFLIKK